jgi:general stress protein YciG
MPNQGGTHEQHVKAGQQSHKNDPAKTQQQTQSGRGNDEQHRGGKGNFAEDRDRAAEAGRKGGNN